MKRLDGDSGSATVGWASGLGWAAAGMVAAGVVVAGMTGCGGGREPAVAFKVVRTVPAVPAAEGRPVSHPNYIALVRADRETSLSFGVGGVVDVLGPSAGRDWQEGDAVRQGETLTRLRQGEFQSAVDSAQASFELAQSIFHRGQKLTNEQAISQQEWDTIQANYLAARAALERARTNLGDSRILAPFDGRVLARLVRPGETVGSGDPVLKIGDLQTVAVELGVPDKAVEFFRKNREIPLVLPALQNRTVTGRVDEVGVAAREEARLFRVVLKVSNADEAIKPGMTATVEVPSGEERATHAVRVPLTALVSDRATGADSPLFVYVVGEDGLARRRPVVTEEIVESSIVVTEGLRAGERVVVLGAADLYEGAPVREPAGGAGGP